MSLSATPATRNEGGCHQVPRLPGKVPRRHRRPAAPKCATRASPVPRVPHLKRKENVDVTKCHTCHAKRKGCRQVPRLPRKSAAASPATSGAQACHQSQPSAISATPEMQRDCRCHQMPHMPRKTKGMSPSATPATQKCRGVTGHQRRPSAPPEPAQGHKCHACHAKRRWMSPSATPATRWCVTKL